MMSIEIFKSYSHGAPTLLFPWLRSKGIEDGICDLFHNHAVDNASFALLDEADLREMGITQIGLRKRLMCLINIWRKKLKSSLSCAEIEPSTSFHTRSVPDCQVNFLPTRETSQDDIHTSDDTSSIDNYLSHSNSGCHYDCRHLIRDRSESYSICEVEIKLWKVGISALYACLAFGLTSFVMVLVHEQLPDISKYPPLPDVLLDNLPYIPWAFEAAELVGMTLLLIWIIILIFHKHRFIIFRRYCCLIGTVFLLRSVTMFITSLSVPSHHLSTECKPFVFHSFRERLKRASEICLGMGMTLQGVRTCGDYMFSGHTTVITMLNFFITEYTPTSYHPLHTFSWILNIFGVFFILAAHEHYSIDVFIAMYITSRLFLYYHWLANNHFLMRRDKERAKIWFPLFSFFEADVRGTVPPEFTNPFQDICTFLCLTLKSAYAQSRGDDFASMGIPPKHSCATKFLRDHSISSRIHEKMH